MQNVIRPACHPAVLLGQVAQWLQGSVPGQGPGQAGATEKMSAS